MYVCSRKNRIILIIADTYTHSFLLILISRTLLYLYSKFEVLLIFHTWQHVWYCWLRFSITQHIVDSKSLSTPIYFDNFTNFNQHLANKYPSIIIYLSILFSHFNLCMTGLFQPNSFSNGGENYSPLTVELSTEIQYLFRIMELWWIPILLITIETHHTSEKFKSH